MEPDFWSKVIGGNVRSCRGGMTQKELADAVGTTVPVVSRLESGTHLPSLTTLLKIAEALGVTPCQLLTEPKPAKGKKK